jgi:plastocyanin
MQLNKSIALGISNARKKLKPALFCLVALSALVLLAACGGGSTNTGTTPTTSTSAVTPTTGTTSAPTATATQAGNAQTVMIISSGTFAFSPATLTIKAGTTVTWKNTTTVSHTVTSDDGKSFDSGTANPIAPQTGTFSFTFTTAGTFAYHCEIHPFMKATIIVQ